MCLVGLLMRPWVGLMREMGVEPRVLADDLFLYSSGKKHATTMVDAMKASFRYFADIGAKVAPAKCFVTSTSQAARSNLRDYVWNNQGGP